MNKYQHSFFLTCLSTRPLTIFEGNILASGINSSQDFCLGRRHPAMHQWCTRLKLPRAAGCLWIVPPVNRVMGGAPQRIKNSQKLYVKLHLGESFCKCCQPQIHWYAIHKCRWNVLNSDERTQWTVQCCSSAQMAARFACSFNMFYIYQAFILLFHKALHPPSLFISLPVHLSLFYFCDTPSRFRNQWSFSAVWRCWSCFLLAIQIYLQLDTFTIQWTHTVTISTLM